MLKELRPTLAHSFLINWIKDELAQTKKEEFVNTLISSFGLILGLITLIIIVFKVHGENNELKVLGGLVFAASIIVTYLASLLYHSCNDPKRKGFYRLLDHLTIYLMIAGTYTPFTLIILHGAWRWALFSSIWALAILGTFFKSLLLHTFENLSQAIYLLMGWLGICAIKPILQLLAFKGVLWLLAGGLLYTCGIYFYRKDHLFYYHHAIWHLFVLGGTVCHFISIYFYVLTTFPA